MGFGDKAPGNSGIEVVKNKFVDLYKYHGRRTESAQATRNERSIKMAENYDGALSTIRFKLESAYLESIGKDPLLLGSTDKETLDAYINTLSVEQVERHIDLLKVRWEGYIMAKEEDGKKEDVAVTYKAIDGLEELRVKLIS